MNMGGENRRNRYGTSIAKMGVSMSICPTRFISILSIHAPYKTHNCLFKVLICYLYLNILLVVLICIIFKTLSKRFV